MGAVKEYAIMIDTAIYTGQYKTALELIEAWGDGDRQENAATALFILECMAETWGNKEKGETK